MKRFVTVQSIAVLCIAALATFALAAQILSVQVRSGQLREKPGFLSKPIANLPYGDRVNLVGEKNDWKQIASSKKGLTGWMHVSALTEKQIILNPTNKDVAAAASSDEIALAGKGFNKQVEDKYREQANLDYAKVDEMEKIVVPQKYIRDFLAKGKLGNGGAK